MKARKLFSVLFLLLALGMLGPGWCEASYLTPRWSFTDNQSTLPMSIQGSPAIGDDGTIYARGFHYVYALHPDGTLKWSTFIPEGTWTTTPAIGTNDDIICNNGSALYSLNPADGSVNWQFKTAQTLRGAPAISKEGIIYIGADANLLYAVDHGTGEKVWDFHVASAFSKPAGTFFNPVVDVKGTIYALFEELPVGGMGFTTFRLYAINPDGTLNTYTEDLAQGFYEGIYNDKYSPAIGPDGTIYVTTGSYEGPQLRAFSPENLSTKWVASLPTRPTNSPVIQEGVPYGVVVPCQSNIVGIKANGLLDWTLEYPLTGARPTTPAIGHGGVFYFGIFAPYGWGRLVAAGASQIVDEIYMDGPVSSSPAVVRVANQNVLYIGSSHSFSAWNIGLAGIDPGLAHTSWPCDRANLKRNGRVSSLLSASYLVAELKVDLDGLQLGHYCISLGSKLDSAKLSLEKEDPIPARNKLTAFIIEVGALKSKKILVKQADNLIADAQKIVSLLQ